MNNGLFYFKSPVVFALILTIGLAGTVVANSAESEGKIELYVTPETEYLPLAELISHLLESKLKLDVNQIVQYQDVGLRKVANGKGDLFIGLELPPPGEAGWPYSKYELCDLGPIYEDVVSGWAVPGYIPEENLGTAEDLANIEAKNRLHREIIAYESKANILEDSKEVIDALEGLQGYELVQLKESVANSELERATLNEEWIVMTLKRPSLPYSLHDLRFIKKLTDEQSVHIYGRNDLMAKFQSEVTRFLSRFYMSIDLVNELIRTRDRDQEASVRDFVEHHPELVDYWIEGVKAL